MLCSPVKYDIENITEYMRDMISSRCRSEEVALTIIIAYVVIFVVGVIGNVCVCVVIFSNEYMHTQTNFYLASLAVSDLLLLLTGLPLDLAMVDFYGYRLGDWACRGHAYLIRFNSCASIFIICAVTVERWLALRHPFRQHSNRNVKRTILTVALLWLASVLISLPVLFTSKVQRVPLPEWGVDQTWTSNAAAIAANAAISAISGASMTERTYLKDLVCLSSGFTWWPISDDNETIWGTEYCDWDNSEKGLQYHCTCVGFVIFYLIPLILITAMYADIAKRIAPPDLIKCDHCIDEQTKASRNVFKMLVSVTVCFFVFWLPFHMQRLLSLILKYHGGEDDPSIKTLHYIFHCISGCCFYLNCAANPFLFNMFSNSFRKASLSTGKRLSKRIQLNW